MTQLSVNLNKIAVLRNSRGGLEPDPARAARAVIEAGAAGVTLHPRPDQRHVRSEDVLAIREVTRDRVELNLEGNPFAPARGGYPGFLALCAQARPEQVTLVPDGDGQITSDHGFEARDAAVLAPMVAALKDLGARVSVFVDPGLVELSAFVGIGVDRVEIYTGPYAEAEALGDARAALDACVATAQAAASLGLGVNAGHDLSQRNLGRFASSVPGLLEVSIGHALVGEALYDGLVPTVRAYLSILGDARRDASWHPER